VSATFSAFAGFSCCSYTIGLLSVFGVDGTEAGVLSPSEVFLFFFDFPDFFSSFSIFSTCD